MVLASSFFSGGLQHLETFDMRLYASYILRPATLQLSPDFQEEQVHHFGKPALDILIRSFYPDVKSFFGGCQGIRKYFAFLQMGTSSFLSPAKALLLTSI